MQRYDKFSNRPSFSVKKCADSQYETIFRLLTLFKGGVTLFNKIIRIFARKSVRERAAPQQFKRA